MLMKPTANKVMCFSFYANLSHFKNNQGNSWKPKISIIKFVLKYWKHVMSEREQHANNPRRNTVTQIYQLEWILEKGLFWPIPELQISIPVQNKSH